jgi:hypothetical protein
VPDSGPVARHDNAVVSVDAVDPVIMVGLEACLLPTSSNAVADELTPEDGRVFTELATRS